MSYTKGKWEVTEISEGKEVAANFNGELWQVASLEDSPLPVEDCLANAHLIAAAPDMLEALKDARELLEQLESEEENLGIPSPTLQKIISAIDKAEGE